MVDNMRVYNVVRQVPQEAQKAITGGRLKGMTDINPMWRLKTLTEQFGPVGIGWYYEILEKRIEDGANGEKVAFVDINLYVKFDNEWSKPIVGTGGSSLVAKEKSGLYTSDECFKMALTDAISVACKALGMGADVYYAKDRTKYDLNDKPPSPEKRPATKSNKATEAQLKKLYAMAGEKGIPPEDMKHSIFDLYGHESSKDLTRAQASELIDLLEKK